MIMSLYLKSRVYSFLLFGIRRYKDSGSCILEVSRLSDVCTTFITRQSSVRLWECFPIHKTFWSDAVQCRASLTFTFPLHISKPMRKKAYISFVVLFFRHISPAVLSGVTRGLSASSVNSSLYTHTIYVALRRNFS